MEITILVIIGALIIFALAGYAVHLLLALQKQKKALQQARQVRADRLKESIVIIAKAMQSGECNHSEGVLRLKMLLDPLGKKLKEYPSMFALYDVVMDMPTHEARHELKKNEWMKLDLRRESAEADLEQKIKLELHQLLSDIETMWGK
ncbi:transmembrane protein [[Pasteurella] mairii]|uniref:Transmembrane protein n=1 Tax=[Pasteurella] mairii TaxID=757 RepID=A0A379B1Z7_9PAST|nr:transmembrane protein [[Pasteurella] mairii]